MATNLSSSAAQNATSDPRFEPGAYLTDGASLYWVQRAGATPMSLSSHVVVVEDCSTNRVVELDRARVESTCTLVRRAPSP